MQTATGQHINLSLYIGLSAVMCSVFFVCGMWVGEAYVISFETAVSYNPLVYYQMMSRLQNSPFMWITPELWYGIRDAKMEFSMGALALVGSTGAYLAIGPGMAAKCLGLAAHKSRIANKAFELSSQRGELEQWMQRLRENETEGRSSYEKRTRTANATGELVHVGR